MKYLVSRPDSEVLFSSGGGVGGGLGKPNELVWREVVGVAKVANN